MMMSSDIYRKSLGCPSSRTSLGDLVRSPRKNGVDTEVMPQPEQFYVCWLCISRISLWYPSKVKFQYISIFNLGEWHLFSITAGSNMMGNSGK